MFKFWCSTLTLLALLVLNAHAYKNNFGTCARVDSQPHFDMKKMLGHWYVLQATSTSKQCLTYTLTEELGHSGHYLLTETFRPSSFRKFFGARNDIHRTGFLETLDQKNLAVMLYKQPSEIWRYTFTVLKTDYNNYAVIYSCKKIALGMHRWSAIILSRTLELKPEIIKQARAEFVEYNIDVFSLSVINHANCKRIVNFNPTLDEVLDKLFNSTNTKSLINETGVFKTPEPNNTKQTLEEKVNSIFKKPEPTGEDNKEGVVEMIKPEDQEPLETVDDNKIAKMILARQQFIPF